MLLKPLKTGSQTSNLHPTYNIKKMELNIKYEKEDWEKFQSFLEEDIYQSSQTWYDGFFPQFILWLFIAVVFFSYFQSDAEFSWSTAGIVSFLFIMFFAKQMLIGIKLKKACVPSEEGIFFGDHNFIFSDDFIKTNGKNYETSHTWEMVKRIAHTDNAIYLFIDTNYAYIFPFSKLESPEKFYNYLRQKMNAAKSVTNKAEN